MDAIYYVYLLRLEDGRIYTGHTNDPVRRFAEHGMGRGCRTSGVFGRGELIYLEAHPDRPSAVQRERQIKRWTRGKKLALAEGDASRLRALARSTRTKRTRARSRMP